MSLISRLKDLLGDAVGPAHDGAAGFEPGDEKLAVAALLVHVARVDGRIDEAERAALTRLIGERFGLDADLARRLVARGDNLDREVDDVASLIEMTGYRVDERERERLLAMAYAVAAADGGVGEFEEDLVWRLGRLLGFDEGRIGQVRHGAIGGV